MKTFYNPNDNKPELPSTIWGKIATYLPTRTGFDLKASCKTLNKNIWIARTINRALVEEQMDKFRDFQTKTNIRFDDNTLLKLNSLKEPAKNKEEFKEREIFLKLLNEKRDSYFNAYYNKNNLYDDLYKPF